MSCLCSCSLRVAKLALKISLNVAALLACAVMGLLTSCGGRPATPGADNDVANPVDATRMTAVPIAQVLEEIASVEDDSIDPQVLDELKTELARMVTELYPEKVVASAPEGERNQVFDLATVELGTDDIDLTWSEVNKGDYDRDSLVAASDITPIGRYYRANRDSANWDLARFADGDGNGEVNAADMVQIAVNYQNKLDGYNVYRSAAGGGQFNLVATIDRPTGELPEITLSYEYSDPVPDTNHYVYQVRPYHLDDEGASSGLVWGASTNTFGKSLDYDEDDIVEFLDAGAQHVYVKDEVLLSFNERPTISRLFEILQNDIDGYLLGQITYTNLYRVKLNLHEERTAQSVVEARKASNTEYTICYNDVYTLDDLSTPIKGGSKAVSAEPVYEANSWAWDAINCENAWAVADGSGVRVGIIDTGVDIQHEDLLGRCEMGDNLFDYQGMYDDHGHGTHIAGTIAANPDNNLGIRGIAPGCVIYPVKITGIDDSASYGTLPKCSSHFADTSNAVAKAIMDGDCDIINMSFNARLNEGWIQVLKLAEENNVLLVAAAGNDCEIYKTYPAAFPQVLSVGAVVADDFSRAPYSNYGPWVDICAPGGYHTRYEDACQTIASCSTGQLTSIVSPEELPDFFEYMFADTEYKYRYMQGTSMACPHVVGVAALVKSVNPDLTPDEIKSILINTGNAAVPDADAIGPLVDAGAAVLAAQATLHGEAPQADLSADPTSGETPLGVEFDASGSTDSDGTVTNYKWDLNGDGSFGTIAEEVAAAGQATASYTYGTAGTYTAKVKVTDDDGLTDIASVEINVEPGNIAPSADLDAEPTSGQTPLLVQFDASDSSDTDGNITGYTWDLDGDGSFGTTSEEIAAADQATTSYTYTSASYYTIQVRVTDDDGLTDIASVNVNVTQAQDFEWSVEEADNWRCRRSRIAIDMDDNPNIVYNSDDSFCFARKSAGDWEYHKLTDGNYSGMYPSIDVAPAAYTGVAAYVFIHNGTAPGDQIYRGWRNPGDGSFDEVSMPWDAGVHTTYTALQFDPETDDWHMAFISPYGALQHATHFPATSANTFHLVENSDEPIQPDIAVDGYGHAWFAYYCAAANELRVANQTGEGEYNIVTVDGESGAGAFPSIEIDSNGFAHVCYYNLAAKDLKYATNKTGSWLVSTVDSGGQVGQYCALVIDSQDRIHVSYHDGSLTRVKYALHDGTGWSTYIVCDNGNTGYWTSIDVDTNDRPHISFTDGYVDSVCDSKLWYARQVEVAE